jgi:acyl CoA:acetate/3-ketoacid CoA transferase
VPQVREISFNGEHARKAGRDIMYVTERAVMRLTSEGPTLVEIAPGLDLERDVLQVMGFRPAIAPDLRTMDRRIFCEGPMGLAAELG